MKKENEFRNDYPFMVVPFDKVEEMKANKKGMSKSFTRTMDCAIEIMNRQNKHSGVLWKIKKTENEVPNWSVLNKR